MLHNMDQKSFYIHLHRTGTTITLSTQNDEIPYIHSLFDILIFKAVLWGLKFITPKTCKITCRPWRKRNNKKKLPWQTWTSYYTGRWVITWSSILYQEIAFYSIIFYCFHAILHLNFFFGFAIFCSFLFLFLCQNHDETGAKLFHPPQWWPSTNGLTVASNFHVFFYPIAGRGVGFLFCFQKWNFYGKKSLQEFQV